MKNVHGVLHHALKQAVLNGYLRFNPADACILPRNERPELVPLDKAQIALFLKAIRGHRFEDIFIVTLFTEMREGEILGLTWDCVDFERGILTINKQIQLHQEAGIDAYKLVSTKNGRSRSIAAAPSVSAQLKHRRAAVERFQAGITDEWGRHLTKALSTAALNKLWPPLAVQMPVFTIYGTLT